MLTYFAHTLCSLTHLLHRYISYVVIPQGQMNFMADWNVVMFLGSPAIKVGYSVIFVVYTFQIVVVA